MLVHHTLVTAIHNGRISGLKKHEKTKKAVVTVGETLQGEEGQNTDTTTYNTVKPGNKTAGACSPITTQKGINKEITQPLNQVSLPRPRGLRLSIINKHCKQ